MQEHEYKARDKTVKKMSREGLTEENLHSREAVSISQKEREDITLPARAEDSFNFQNIRNQGKDEKHRRLYDSDADRTDFSGETEENVKRKRTPQRTDDSETDQKVSEGCRRGGFCQRCIRTFRTNGRHTGASVRECLYGGRRPR